MPRTRLDKLKYPPINWLTAAILERKQTMKLTWEDLANVAHISPDRMRQLISKKPPEQWPADIRNAVCRCLQINVKLTITDGHEIELD